MSVLLQTFLTAPSAGLLRGIRHTVPRAAAGVSVRMSSSSSVQAPADRLKGFERLCRKACVTTSFFYTHTVGWDPDCIGQAPTVWSEFTPLASSHGAVNLGQGFPDWPSPTFCKEAVKTALDTDFNQYCRSGGLPELVQALARHYSPLFGKDLDPLKEITVTVGTSEGLFASIHSLVNHGDEVILLEPAFDIYSAQVKMAGGECVYVPLRPPDETSPSWHLDMKELEAAFTPRTRLLMINTPHNPTGKVFKREELMQIIGILERFPRVIVVADEVYENLVYDDNVHIRIATLPGMWERTLTLSSAGKTFSVTGWKIGWAIGHERLVQNVMCCNQWVQFSIATPLQRAVADMLDRARQPYEGHESYYHWIMEEYKRKRDLLVKALQSAGITPIIPEGGFFITADTSKMTFPEKYLQETTPAAPKMSRDWAFCRWLTIEVGVAAIPPSAFYCEGHKPLAANLARFAFCKTDESLIEAQRRFQAKFNDVNGDK